MSTAESRAWHPPRRPVHDVEAFGPVSTASPTATSPTRSPWPRADTHPRRIGGHPRPAVARELVLAWHTTDELLVLDRDGRQGVPRPRLAPPNSGAARTRTGRGGGNSAASAGYLHHMQRTAIQASPDMMTAITGQWNQGAVRDQTTCPSLPQAPRRAQDRRHHRGGPRTVMPRGHRHFSQSFTGTPSRSHRPGGRRKEPALRGVVATLPGGVLRRVCSSNPTRARCWPTSASTDCGS